MSDYIPPEPVAKQIQYQTSLERLTTFTETSLDQEIKEECARAGFIMVKNGYVWCVFCELTISCIEITESVLMIHARKNPNCPYIKFYTKMTLNTKTVFNNDKPDAVQSKSIYPCSEYGIWEDTSAVKAVLLLGYSDNVVRTALQRLKQAEQSLDTDSLVDQIILIETSSVDNSTNHSSLQNTRQNANCARDPSIEDSICTVDRFAPDFKANEKTQIVDNEEQLLCNQELQLRRGETLNDFFPRERKIVTQVQQSSILSRRYDSSNAIQDDAVDGCSLDAFTTVSTASGARPKTAYTSLPFINQNSAKRRPAIESKEDPSRLSESISNSPVPTIVEDECDEALSLNATTQFSEFQFQFDGNSQPNRNTLQPIPIPRLPPLPINNTPRTLHNDEGFSEIEEDVEIFDKCETSDARNDARAGFYNIDERITSEGQRNGENCNATTMQALLSIPDNTNTQRGRSRTISESSSISNTTKISDQSEGYYSMRDDKAKGTDGRLSGASDQHSQNEKVRAANGKTSTSTTTETELFDGTKPKEGMKMFSDLKHSTDPNSNTDDSTDVKGENGKGKKSDKSKAKKSKSPKRKKKKSTTRLEYEKLFKQVMCNSCWQKSANCLYLPCRHLNRCEECSENLENCPKCDDEIIATVRVYFS